MNVLYFFLYSGIVPSVEAIAPFGPRQCLRARYILLPVGQVDFDFGLEFDPVEMPADEALGVKGLFPGEYLSVEAESFVIGVHFRCCIEIK